MQRKKATDFPQELLNLFDNYVHGDIERRDFLEGAKRFAVGGVTVAALYESLKPNYAWAQQVPKDDPRLRTEYAMVHSPQGNGSIKGYLARPAKGTEAEVEERQTNCGQNSLRVQFSRTGDANKMQNGREKVP